jgi:hypothetical protein
MNGFSLSFQFYTFSSSMKSDIGLEIQSFRWRRPFLIGWIIPIRGCHLPDLTIFVPLAPALLPPLSVPCVRSRRADLRPPGHFMAASVQTPL